MFIGGSLIVPIFAGSTLGPSHGEMIQRAYCISQGGKAYISGSYDTTDSATAIIRFKVYAVNATNATTIWYHDDGGYIYINGIQSVFYSERGIST